MAGNNLRKIIEMTAEKHGVSVAEVEREIKYSIKIVFKNPTAEVMAIPRKGDTPTVEEFIDFYVKKLADMKK
jgi:predicted SPOUT superfamily RNA methylase MTH1